MNYNKDDLNYTYIKLYDENLANHYFEQLEQEIEYLDNPTILVYGKEYQLPRKMVGYGDPGLSYTFSGITVKANPWIPLLLKIKYDVAMKIGSNFNYVLINRYKNGHDSISSHQDNENDLHPTAPIVSVSLGAEREFVFKRKGYKSHKIVLENGSLLIMKYPTNKFWYHELPKCKELSLTRISLTFRRMINKERTFIYKKELL